MKQLNQPKSLQAQGLRGILWSAMDLALQRGITFVVSLVLARLLLPEQFGLIAMVAVFVTIAMGIADAGFSSALIQRKNPSGADLSTVYYLNIGISLLLIGIIYLCAPPIAAFYQEPELVLILRVLALGILVDSLSRVHVTLLKKNLKFKRLAVAAFPGNIAGGVIGVWMALAGYGVWALVSATLLTRMTQMFLYWTVSPWRPVFVFSFESLKSLFPYGSRLALAGLLNNVFSNIYVLIIGRLFTAFDVGQYQKASGFKNLATLTIFEIVSRVSFPLLSLVQDDPIRLRSGFLRAFKLTGFITLPCMAFLAGSSEALVTFLIGEAWLASGKYLQIICVPGALFSLHYLNVCVLKVIGRSDLVLRLEVLKKVLVTAAILITVKYGIIGLLCGQVVVTFICFYINSIYTRRYLNASFLVQGKALLPSLALAGIVFLGSYLPVYLDLGRPFINLLTGAAFAGFSAFVVCVLLRHHLTTEMTFLKAFIAILVRNKTFA